MTVLRMLESLRVPAMDGLMQAVTELGSEVFFLVVALVLFWCVSKQEGYYLLTVGFFGTVLNQFLKLLCRVPRPWVLDPEFTIVESARADATGYSFPSGHTQNSVGTFGVLGRCARRTWVRILCGILMILVPFSRMYLGVHYPSDVLCGMVLGILFGLAALIVLRKNATVKSLDFIVPVMAVCYFVITVGIVVLNLRQLPAVLARIFAEAFGLRQVAAGGFGAVLMNGVKRGLFSNEAGSGSAPCAAAAAECDDPVKMGLVQALGVLIDTVVICSCTAFLMLLVPQEITAGLTGMNLLQTAMQYHLGSFGIVFIAVILALFSFSTFLGVLYYARGNVAYLCGDNWWSQTAYKLLALAMLLVGGTQAYTVVWDLGDVGIGLMTIFNMLALVPLSGEALTALNDYEMRKKIK